MLETLDFTIRTGSTPTFLLRLHVVVCGIFGVPQICKIAQ